MPSFNRTAADQPAELNFATLAAQYLAAPLKAQADATALIGLNLQRQFKRPSVFAARSAFSSIYNYQLESNSNFGNYLQYYALESQINVYVFNIEDAAVVKMGISGTNFIGPIMGYSLSPSNFNVPIIADNFALTTKGNAWAISQNAIPGEYTPFANCFLWDEIPCDGNRYIHVFAASPYIAQSNSANPAYDLIAVAQNTNLPLVNFTLALLK